MGVPYKVLALFLVLSMAAAMPLAPASETDAARVVELDGIIISFPSPSVFVGIGDTEPFYIDLYNSGEEDRVLYIKPTDSYGGIDLSFSEHEDGSPGDRIFLAGGGSSYIRFDVAPAQECGSGLYNYQFEFRSHDPTFQSNDETITTGFSFHVYVTDPVGVYYAQADDISISPSINRIDIVAGDSAPLYLDIKNTLKDRSLVVYVYPDVSDEISISFPEGQRIVLGPEELGYSSMMITVDKYAEEKDYEISFRIMINDPERGSVIESNASSILSVYVTSEIISDNYQNRFFGYFENNLPSIFGESWFPALITLIAFVCVAYLIGMRLIPYIIRRFFKEGGDEV